MRVVEILPYIRVKISLLGVKVLKFFLKNADAYVWVIIKEQNGLGSVTHYVRASFKWPRLAAGQIEDKI